MEVLPTNILWWPTESGMVENRVRTELPSGIMLRLKRDQLVYPSHIEDMGHRITSINVRSRDQRVLVMNLAVCEKVRIVRLMSPDLRLERFTSAGWFLHSIRNRGRVKSSWWDRSLNYGQSVSYFEITLLVQRPASAWLMYLPWHLLWKDWSVLRKWKAKSWRFDLRSLYA